MKYALMQHWSGPVNSLVFASLHSMREYAAKIGAQYIRISGSPFDPTMTPPCQKIHMLHEKFDEFDKIVMVDADMFPRKGMDENVFTETSGIGRHTEIQTKLRANLAARNMGGDVRYPYWGGSIYCLTREQRQLFRSKLRFKDYKVFDGNYEDEGIMHRLAVLSQYPEEGAYLPGNHWNCGSFEKERYDSAFIHVRTKRNYGGPKYPKIENLAVLIQEGLIDKEIETVLKDWKK